MGPPWPAKRAPSGLVVYSTAKGANVLDVDGNRFVDLAAGFGSMLLGHAHPRVTKVLELQAARLLQALGDVHPSEPRIAITERLVRLYPLPGARVILGQSGSDAIDAALKTAQLHTGKSKVVAFTGSYHGLGHGPLATTSLRKSYRQPFAATLSSHVQFLDFPHDETTAEMTIERLRFELSGGDVAAVLIEPILGRGGVVLPPPEFMPELIRLSQLRGAVVIADEVWTGLGRAGSWLVSCGEAEAPVPDLICLGKGLGGGLPLSACIGSDEVMGAWERPTAEVVHTSTFAGAPLSCCTAIATLDILSRDALPERAGRIGRWLLEKLKLATAPFPRVREVRGQGLMIGLDLGDRPGAASELTRELLERGYLVSTGGGRREVLVLTPPLVIAESQLEGFVAALVDGLHACGP